MKIKELTNALERFAPLPLQDGYDNAGLQVGLTEAEASGVLLCLDVTEQVLQEAVNEGCNLVVSHHPLLFHGLKAVADRNQVERCVRMAVQHNVAVYSAHTNLDNAVGGVNFRIAEKLHLHDVAFLQPRTIEINGKNVRCGSGVIGSLTAPVPALDFLQQVKQAFEVKCLMHNELLQRNVQKIALCGGAGDFLLPDAIAAGADVFLTGEMHYHTYFGHDGELQIAVIGHYQSEQFTKEIFYSIIREACPDVPVKLTALDTNPINYL